ncbi:hypothetical protein QNI19_01190 [Cytophagaceae bacterium DM2B3-1]|uniref:DUF4595 domain-containing protein n=1 Tax=Xanthocytophaga flava TaxID=3048013 RepID=A0AAE3QQH4_9BACT|nr:hypothetical protein [Xanthocytophaga flavus]MDJ1481543.1 hypothetical protein [Xanthocytophaga flavus]MDJ1491522.1 hypothetical protein [Xanthocytophaga flavus]
MKRLVHFPAFLMIVFGISACQEQEQESTVRSAATCQMTQYNNVVFHYSSTDGKLQSLDFPEGSYTFEYGSDGYLASVEAVHSGTTYAVKTDSKGNITEAMDYQFNYDDQNRLVMVQKLTGEISSYRRFEYDTNGNLSKVFTKALSSVPVPGAPPVKEVLSLGNFLYDANNTPWQSDATLKWVVLSSLLTPFEVADQVGAYSLHNCVGYSIYYAEDMENPRFTSSVNYTYSSTQVPVQYNVTGNAGAYSCSYNYQCGND